MPIRLFVALVALALFGPVNAQPKQRIEKADDLPRFNYEIDGQLEPLVRDDTKFAAFGAEVRRDTESTLAKYDIADRATERELLTKLLLLDLLDGRYDSALKRAALIRDLQDKPAAKLLSGLTARAIVAAERKAGNVTSSEYRTEVARSIADALKPLPYDVIANDLREAKASVETLGEGRLIGALREQLQPIVDKSGGLSSDLAPRVIEIKYALTYILPLKQTLVDAYESYLAAHRVVKQDIWAARDLTLPADRGYTPVRIGIWDSGVDTHLFPQRTVMDSGKPAVIAFDRYANPATGELMPIPSDLESRVPDMKARLKGFSDLRSNIDSPEASEVKQFFSTLQPDAYKKAVEELSLVGDWMHGTHVAGITVKGNPYAQLVVGRIGFDWHLLPDPCPSRELAERDARNMQSYVDFFKRHGVRVVNMSWGGSVKDFEEALEQCNIGKTTDERKALAREYFEIQKNALTKAMASAPQILFVAAAGNSNNDASFIEDIPAGIVLPNLIVVGAVDLAGDEASFTSYGPTVVVHANGYQVESVIPGGEKLAESGTSMAAPQVSNLAGKILAVDPQLKATDVIAIIRSTADTTADGRRRLINPRKAVEAAMTKKAA
ncbi:MAG TPA: S8 family serine peptidase [Casimicrobiaceae bacterium]|nr:S8 family serine peptidase [Casimicrobiaceae bacterium]